LSSQSINGNVNKPWIHSIKPIAYQTSTKFTNMHNQYQKLSLWDFERNYFWLIYGFIVGTSLCVQLLVTASISFAFEWKVFFCNFNFLNFKMINFSAKTMQCSWIHNFWIFRKMTSGKLSKIINFVISIFWMEKWMRRERKREKMQKY
jgi:hypothetical protein